MSKFLIESKVSGHVFGVYEGDSPEDALETYARDAGYASMADQPPELGGTDDLLVRTATDEDAAEYGFVPKQ